MEQTATDEILDLLGAYVASSALGVALELGLFWHLEKQPQGLETTDIAQLLEVPTNRCRYWLQSLVHLGLIEQPPHSDRFVPSSKARAAILDTYSQNTWALLAQEAREHFPVFLDLALHFHKPGSLWAVSGLTPPMYIAQMTADPERARRFTRMLFELHQPLADELANVLEMGHINRLMDLGGGSGVVSLALLRRFPSLTAVVVDIDNVCQAGREIAVENALEDRITYHAADFVVDELPPGFDMVLECDVAVYDEALFAKVRDALNSGGRFVIIDQLAPAKGVAPTPRLDWALQGSLVDSEFTYPTAEEILSKLDRAGFQTTTHYRLAVPGSKATRFTDDMIVIEARK